MMNITYIVSSKYVLQYARTCFNVLILNITLRCSYTTWDITHYRWNTHFLVIINRDAFIINIWSYFYNLSNTPACWNETSEIRNSKYPWVSYLAWCGHKCCTGSWEQEAVCGWVGECNRVPPWSLGDACPWWRVEACWHCIGTAGTLPLLNSNMNYRIILLILYI